MNALGRRSNSLSVAGTCIHGLALEDHCDACAGHAETLPAVVGGNEAIDNSNRFLVAGSVAMDGEISILRPPGAGERISQADALNLAAYLVALCQRGRERFVGVLHAVENA